MIFPINTTAAAGNAGSNSSSSAATKPSSSTDATASQASSTVGSSGYSDTVSISVQAQWSMKIGNLTVSEGPLGEAYAPQLFGSADSNGDGSLSQAEFTNLVAQGGGDAKLAQSMYTQMGGTDNGLSYQNFKNGLSSGPAVSFFSDMVASVMRNMIADDSAPLLA